LCEEITGEDKYEQVRLGKINACFYASSKEDLWTFYRLYIWFSMVRLFHGRWEL